MGPRLASEAIAPWLRAFIIRYGIAIVIILMWQLVTMRANSLFFPTPMQILSRAYELWLSGPAHRLFLGDGVFKDILPSLCRLLGRLDNRSRRRYVPRCAHWSLAGTARSGRSRTSVSPRHTGTGARPSLSYPARHRDHDARDIDCIWFHLACSIEHHRCRTVDPLQLDTGKSFKLPPVARFTRIILPQPCPRSSQEQKYRFRLRSS